MRRVRQFASDHPIPFVLALVAVYFAVFAIPPLLTSNAFGGDASKSPQTIDVGQLPLEIGLAASIVAILLIVWWGHSARLTSKPDWSGIWAPAIYALFTLALLGLVAASTAYQGVDVGAVIATVPLMNLILLVVLVGVFEEGLFRGAVLHGFEIKIGPLAAALMSSVLFGAMHFVNWIAGQPLGPTTDQVIHAGLSGLLYVGITLRMNSIWFGAATHALWDGVISTNGQLNAAAIALAAGSPAAVDATTTGEPAGAGIGVLGLLITYFEPILGVIVLWAWWRRSRRDTIDP